MADFNTIDDFDVNGKTVLLRIDINSPVDPNSGIILDDTRMKLHSETIKELSLKGAKVVIIAHQSRPGKNDFTKLDQHAVELSRCVGLEVKYGHQARHSYRGQGIFCEPPDDQSGRREQGHCQ